MLPYSAGVHRFCFISNPFLSSSSFCACKLNFHWRKCFSFFIFCLPLPSWLQALLILRLYCSRVRFLPSTSYLFNFRALLYGLVCNNTQCTQASAATRHLLAPMLQFWFYAKVTFRLFILPFLSDRIFAFTRKLLFASLTPPCTIIDLSFSESLSWKSAGRRKTTRWEHCKSKWRSCQARWCSTWRLPWKQYSRKRSLRWLLFAISRV